MNQSEIKPGEEFSGLVAVITGGTGGIGSATAKYLADRGAKIALIDLTVSGDENYFSVACDITSDTDVDRAISAIADKFGGIDILVNNAGIGAGGDVTANNDEEWLAVFNVNLFGAVRVTRHALPYLQKSQHPAIVNTSSIVADVG